MLFLLGCCPFLQTPAPEAVVVPPVHDGPDTFPADVAPIAPGGAPAALVVSAANASGCEVSLLSLPELTSRSLAQLEACPDEIHLSASGQAMLLVPSDLSAPALLVSSGGGAPLPLPPAVPPLAHPESFSQRYVLDGEAVGLAWTWAETRTGDDCEGPCFSDMRARQFARVDGAWTSGGVSDRGTRLDPYGTEPQADIPVDLSTLSGQTPDGWNVSVATPRVAWATRGQGEGGSSGGPVLIEVGGKWWSTPGFTEGVPASTDRVAHYLVLRGERDTSVLDLRAPAIVWRSTAVVRAWPAAIPAWPPPPALLPPT